jgi:rod shape-determining protein MreD
VIKFILITIALYFLTLFQTSFLVHFAIFGITPNIVAFAVIIWNIFEKKERSVGYFVAIIAGLFLDIFSNGFIGINIIILVAIVASIKLLVKRYVKIPFFEEL